MIRSKVFICNFKAFCFAICITCVFSFVFQSIFSMPKFSDLIVKSYVLDDSPKIDKGMKGRISGMLPVNGTNLFIENICDGDKCALPSSVAMLRKSDKITVWREKSHVYQIAENGEKIYSYDDAATAHARNLKLICIQVSLLIFIFIYILAYKIIVA